MTVRAILTVTAGAAAICSAISRTVASRSSRGTTRLTTPWARASSTGMTRPVSTRSLTTPGPAICCSTAMPPVSGITPCVSSGSRNRVPSAATADVAQQRPLERATHDPALAGHQHRGVDLPQLLDAPVTLAHELVVGEVDLERPDRTDVATRRERPTLPPPDHGSHVRPGPDLTERGEQLRVHGVIERVVLLVVVVGDGGDAALDLQPHVPRRRHAPDTTEVRGVIPEDDRLATPPPPSGGPRYRRCAR